MSAETPKTPRHHAPLVMIVPSDWRFADQTLAARDSSATRTNRLTFGARRDASKRPTGIRTEHSSANAQRQLNGVRIRSGVMSILAHERAPELLRCQLTKFARIR